MKLKFNFFDHGNLQGKIRNTQILRAETSILDLLLYLIFITMSKAKHPTNVVLLTESEHFVHISALL